MPKFIIEEFLAHLEALTEKTYVTAETLQQKPWTAGAVRITVLPGSENEVYVDKAHRISPAPDDYI